MIGFTFPWALVGLLAAALPILLHLAQRRQPPEVAFPAVRYLDDTTKEHRRRLKLRHWLLLAVRTLLIIVLVLAAAGMTVRRGSIGGHPPSALVLVIDNSASSSAMVDGTPVLSRLTTAGRTVLDRATTADRLWLLSAEGTARAGSAAELRTELAHLAATAARLDLGAAIAQGRELIHGVGLPGSVVLLTDLQRSALSAAPGAGRIVVMYPESAAIVNRGLLQVEPEAQPWGLTGGDVRVAMTSSDTTPVPVTLTLGGERGTHREVLLTPGIPATVHLEVHTLGWNVLTAAIPPDEFRLDDITQVAIHVTPSTVVTWNAGDKFINAALEVLAADRRIVAGEGVHVGSLGSRASLLLPPEDPAQIGGINRALAARGVPWQWERLIETPTSSDSNALLPARTLVSKRVSLRSTGAHAEVLATVQGEPWLVRGGGVLLLGSRLDPAWTDLPLSAAFVPLLDALLTRVVQGAPAVPMVNAGASFVLPTQVNGIAHDGVIAPVEGGAPWRSDQPGVSYLLAGSDTLSSLTVRVDPRESALQPATPAEVQSLWPGAVVATLAEGPGLAFATGRGDLRKGLLLVALACVLTETLLARRGAPVLR